MDEYKFASKNLQTNARKISRVGKRAVAKFEIQVIDATPESTVVCSIKIVATGEEAHAQVKKQQLFCNSTRRSVHLICKLLNKENQTQKFKRGWHVVSPAENK